jgi:hypothetical protein
MNEDYCTDYICFGCKCRVNHAGFQQRVNAGKVKRINVKGEFKTFHANCFELYKKDHPNWFNEITKEN